MSEGSTLSYTIRYVTVSIVMGLALFAVLLLHRQEMQNTQSTAEIQQTIADIKFSLTAAAGQTEALLRQPETSVTDETAIARVRLLLDAVIFKENMLLYSFPLEKSQARIIDVLHQSLAVPPATHKRSLDATLRTALDDIGYALNTLHTVKSTNTEGRATQTVFTAAQDRIQTLQQHILPEIIAQYTKLGDKIRHAQVNDVRGWILLQYGLLAMCLGLLFIQIFIVFRPIGRQLQSTIDTLKGERHALEINRLAMEENETRLDLALSGTSTGIWDWNLKTNEMFWSPQICMALGLGSGEFGGKLHDFETRVVPDDLHETMTLARRHLEQGAPFDCELRMRHADGHLVWVRMRGQAIWDASGKPTRMAGAMEDISEKKRMQMRSDLFIKGMVASNIAVGIIDMGDAAKRFMYVSPALCALTGYSEDKLLNANMNIFIGPDTMMSDLDAVDGAMAAGEGLTIELLSYRQDGTSYRNKLQLTPVFDDSAVLRAYVNVHYDMTRDIQREKQEVNRQRMESLGTLASNVAHEINNLLVPMMMADDIIGPDIKADADPYTYEHLKQIVSYAEQARSIVQGVLTFARKETETRVLVSVVSVLRDAIDFVSGLMRTDIRLTVDIAPDFDALVLINRTEFRQIFTNFVNNAEYALSDRADPTIHIGVSQKSLSARERQALDINQPEQVEITFQDNGKGIPEDLLPRIFEPLFTTKPIGEGTGLGLSVVHGILRSWGGGIAADSKVGIGTTFRLYIPINMEHDELNLYADLLDELNES